MPDISHVHGTPFSEEKWEEAKKRAAEEGHEGEYDYIMGIYKRMSRSGEYREKYSRERKKKKQSVSEWKEKNPNWKKKLKKGFTLVIGGDLDEYRCPDCDSLLLKGKNLEKSMVEIKCKRCGALVGNHHPML